MSTRARSSARQNQISECPRFKPDYINIPKQLYNSPLQNSQELFREALRKDYEFIADLESIKFWRPVTHLSDEATEAEWQQFLLDVSKRSRVPWTKPFQILLDNFENKDIIHLIVTADAEHLNDEVNEGLGVVERWRSKRAKAELPAVNELTSIVDHPLSEEEKIPLSNKFLRSLISHELDDTCTAADVALLFRATNYESDPAIIRFYAAVKSRPPPEGTKDSYHGFWDRNINDIIAAILPDGKMQRNSNRDTATKGLRPDYAFLLNRFCLFRGEEKAPNSTGNPKAELAEKLHWVYDPAPYVLGALIAVFSSVGIYLTTTLAGYHAIGTNVALAAILRPRSDKTQAVVYDIARADLRLRKARTLHLRRLINLAGILQTLPDIVRNHDAEFEILERFCSSQDNSTIEIVSHAVIKTYKDSKRVEHLQNIYALIQDRNVPNTDRPLHTEGSRIILKPRGISRVPKTQRELLGAVACVLETLAVSHSFYPTFHRDIRWPNVMARLDDDNRWFLIDWEDASNSPTLAQPHFARKTHCPTIFVDGHGAEVDIWGVGELILRCEGLDVSSELKGLGKWMQEAPAPSAQEALNKVKEYQSTLP
ncbi:hypothetical protein Clacol_008648 [Clathrus columnatus]|uniref:Protein kinase domain-containing protein n=1 Tax=Clathrus columnatus TaxID=1419009 RepID=A0AAV5AIE1_9AGAM|nr:hypothetical protein Clacol_008648 [Clathrus columnatus]